MRRLLIAALMLVGLTGCGATADYDHRDLNAQCKGRGGVLSEIGHGYGVVCGNRVAYPADRGAGDR